MQNIDLFNEYVARILAQLYESFPVKEKLYASTISGHTDDNRYGTICAPDGSESKEAQVAFHTIGWLVDNGYVRAEQRLDGRYYDYCALTEKGLKVLQAVPDSVQTTETVGEKLVRLTKEGGGDLARDFIKSLLTLGVQGLV